MTEERNDAGTVQLELLRLARGLDRATDELMEATRAFEGGPDENGEWRLGVNLRFDSAVTAAEQTLVDGWDNTKRLPAQDRLHRMAENYVEKMQPDLFANYHRLKSQIALTQKVITARKTSISARQSVLSAERSMGR